MSPSQDESVPSNLASGDDKLTSALAQLRLKLLDLTGRNRLINFKHTAGKSLQFVEGQFAAIYQKLVEANNKIEILGLPEPARREWVERNGRLSRPDPKDWARKQNIPTEYDLPFPDDGCGHANVRALMYPDDLAKHCRKIEREAVLAIEETGANMLFLVLGFLEFPDQQDSGRIFAAPLISIPVTMAKAEKGGKQVFFLQHTGDDISDNLSLYEKLKNDYGLTLPEVDEDQADIEGYFLAIQKIIKAYPQFSVRRRASLCILSFTNMLLVRDLDPANWPQKEDRNNLTDHPIIKIVFEGTSGEEGTSLSFAQEHSVEEEPGATIPLVYDADSSQHSALVDAHSLGKNLVIEGPPGTGKSQTITNLIAACLATGKKVLFVAEKLAALDVVKNRLTLAGLEPFALELHSNKTNKKRVLEELAKRIKFHATCPVDLPKKLQEIEAHRSELKAYSDIINAIAHNAFGLTLHQVMWRAEKHRQALSVEEAFLTQIVIADATEISAFKLSGRMDCLRHLGSQYSEIGGFDTDSTFWGFFPERIIPGDEVQLRNTFTTSCEWAGQFAVDGRAIGELLQGDVVGLSLEFANTQLEVLKNLLATVDEKQPLHLIPGFFAGDTTGNRARHLLEELSVQIERYQRLHPAVKEGLRLESSVTQTKLNELNQLQRLAEQCGTVLGNSNEISRLTDALVRDHERLSSGLGAIGEFCKSKGIPFDGSRQNMLRIAEFAQLVIEAPVDLFHLQCTGLARDGCYPALEALSKLQGACFALEKEMGEELYLDALPPEATIKEAILTLREGDAWYRNFQGPWRSAISLHKRLQRIKQRIPAKDRLGQLETLSSLLQLKDRWKSHPAWLQYLGFPAPAVPHELDGYVALARWNRAIQVSQEEIQSTIFTPTELDARKAINLRHEFAVFNTNLATAHDALKHLDLLPKLSEACGTQSIEKVAKFVKAFSDELASQLDWIRSETLAQSSFSRVLSACEAAVERQQISIEVNTNSEVRNLLGEWFAGADTDIQEALNALSFGQGIDGLNLSGQIKAKLRSAHPGETAVEIADALQNVCNGLTHVAELEKQLAAFGKIELSVWFRADISDSLADFSSSLAGKLSKAADEADLLIPWSLYIARRKEADDMGLANFVNLLERTQVKPGEIADAYAYCTYYTIVREAFRNVPQLGRFTGLKHNQIRDEFKRLDKEIIHLRGKEIAALCCKNTRPPSGRNGTLVDDRTEMVLLNYLLPQQRPRMPVRKMLKRAGRTVQALKPCFMMGPQAVAQYLVPGAIQFDLVIMDEASQLKPEEAVGSIARGGQLVVVGDPKQLPPTSFFSRMTQSIEDDEQYSTTDAESILDVCTAQFHPTRALRWHYRSQHHSLIAFSNQHFYRNNLIIFPSPYGQSSRLGVRATYLADAIYENQTNLKEAKRVVDAVAEHLTTRPDESLGVVTLNIKQRDLIAELLEERLRNLKGADAYRERWVKEGQPLFIKNLENVQGDERDVIIISTTFGKPPGASAVRQNFGPISRQGGWRRLNVLFTRARKSIAIYTSLRPEDIVMDGTTPDGTKALRNYL
jgi:hypothetical protein